MIYVHAVWLKILTDASFQICIWKGEVETSSHFLDPGEIAETDISGLIKFVVGSKLFVVL